MYWKLALSMHSGTRRISLLHELTTPTWLHTNTQEEIRCLVPQRESFIYRPREQETASSILRDKESFA